MTDKPFKWSDVKSLVSVWLLAIVISFCSLITSCGIVYSERVTHSCSDSGHGFSARYEKRTDQEVLKLALESLKEDEHPSYVTNAMSYATHQAYIADVCEYCGDTVIAPVTVTPKKVEEHGAQTEDTR